MERPISIQSLPLESIVEILTYFEYYQSHLLICALVHTSWTCSALSLLYRYIVIKSTTQAIQVAHPPVRQHLEGIITLDVGGGSDYLSWIPELEVVLRMGVRLQQLNYMKTFRTYQRMYFTILHYLVRKFDLETKLAESESSYTLFH